MMEREEEGGGEGVTEHGGGLRERGINGRSGGGGEVRM